MNLFRSEEHIRDWDRFDAKTEGGIITLSDLARLFSCEMFQKRLDPHYFSVRNEYREEFREVLAGMAKTNPFWAPGS